MTCFSYLKYHKKKHVPYIYLNIYSYIPFKETSTLKSESHIYFIQSNNQQTIKRIVRETANRQNMMAVIPVASSFLIYI